MATAARMAVPSIQPFCSAWNACPHSSVKAAGVHSGREMRLTYTDQAVIKRQATLECHL